MKIKNSKPNILFLLHLPPPIHGSSVIGKAIKDSQIINEAFNCTYINLLASNNIAESGNMSLKKMLSFIPILLKVFYSIIKYRPKLCYLALTTKGAAFYRDVLLVTLLWLFGVKRVYHLHNKGVSVAQENKINKILYQFVFANSDIILLSIFLYKDIQSFVPLSRVMICPNGIKKATTVFNYSHISEKPSVKILFLSNLIVSKGVFVLLEACSLLQIKGLDFTCDFIGGEGDITISRFNEIVKNKQLSNKVKYLGKKYGLEKQTAFSGADIFAFPTYYHNETFGLVNLEAMQNSLPIVSTFEGGIPDIVKDGINGFLVPQKDAQALANKLEVLIVNPLLRKEMGLAGKKFYEEKFTIDIFENRLLEILEELRLKL